MSYDDIHIENDEQRFRACIFWWDFTKGRRGGRGWWWLWWSWLLTLLEDRRDPTTLSLSITLEVQQAAPDRIIGRVINGRRGFQRMRHVRMEMGCWAASSLQVSFLGEMSKPWSQSLHKSERRRLIQYSIKIHQNEERPQRLP